MGIGRGSSRISGCRYITLDAQRDVLSWYERFGFVVNTGENIVVKFVRSRKLGRSLEKLLKKEPHFTSMRYDLLLESEVPGSIT